MLLREIADRLIRVVSGGTDVVDSKWEPRYIEAIIPSLRERAIKYDYFGTRDRGASRRLDYSLTQSIDLAIDSSLQDQELDYIIFELPKPISLNRMIDGLVYVGKKKNSVSFTKFLNREDIANAKMRGQLNGESIGYIWQAPYLEVYGNNALREANVRMIAADPINVPNFNPDTDDYPISEDLILLMEDIFKAEQNISVNKPADNILDGADTTTRAIINQNLR